MANFIENRAGDLFHKSGFIKPYQVIKYTGVKGM